MFYFIRHGEPDYSQRGAKIYRGFGVHLAGLSEEGVRQIQKAAGDARLEGAELIVSSPYTRTLQTAAILSKELRVDIAVEPDLYEWLANKDFIYEEDEAARAAYEEYKACHGAYPDGKAMPWESAASMRERALGALAKYASCRKVIVACHGMLIQALAGGKHPAHGEITAFDWDGQSLK